MFERACLRGTELIKGKLTGIVFGENDKKPKVKGTLLSIIKEPFVKYNTLNRLNRFNTFNRLHFFLPKVSK